MSIAVIIDTDPGIDDALALALALRAPELSVLGVSTVYGNASAAVTTRNARHLLERLGRTEVPLLGGASRPLVRAPSHALDTHGKAGLGYATVPELPAGPHQNEAPVGLLALLAQSRAPVTVIALGPLTNLALALALDREVCRRAIREIIWMGGSAGAPGNTTPVSEWNAWCDPEAARAVLEAAIPVRMVGLDATRSVLLSKAAVQALGRGPDPEVRWWADMWRFYVEFHERSEALAGCIMNDPLAILTLLRPDLLQWQEMYVEVDCGWGLTRGQTLCDRFGFTGKPVNVSVCLEAAGEEALAVILQRALGVVL